jgi:hypothetical protein
MRKNKRRSKPKRRDDFDQALRHASRQFPGEVARVLLRTRLPIEPLEWAETQVTARQRRLDRALSLRVDGERRVLHVEWILRMTRKIALRVFEYSSLTALALAGEARARHPKKPPPIESVVVVLSGREERWPSRGEYRTSPPGKPFSGVRFRIEAVYQRTVAQLRARGTFWMIFAPLAADADAIKLARVVQELRARASPEAFDELGLAMATLAEADKRKRGFRDVIKSLLPEELVMQSWIFKEGKAEGRKQGEAEGRKQGEAEGLKKGKAEGRREGLEKGHLETLAHQFERRLARPLTAAERKRLRERLRAEGPMKVGDLVIDLSPAELSACLASSNGPGS